MGVRHPELVVAGAAACCAPMVPGLLDGQIAAASAGERFLVALLVCWAIGSVLSWVLTSYGQQARRREVQRLVDTDDPGRAGPAAE